MNRRNKAEEQSAQPHGEAQEAVERDINELLASVQKTSEERDQLRDQLLRTMADFQNFRRRQEDQRKQLELFATEKLVTSLLPVLDNFERALGAFDSGGSPESLADGVRAVERQLRQVLEGQGVVRIAAKGEPFDPEYHEALVSEPSDEHEENTIIGELEPGYRMGDKVIRPARVRVAKKP